MNLKVLDVDLTMNTPVWPFKGRSTEPSELTVADTTSCPETLNMDTREPGCRPSP